MTEFGPSVQVTSDWVAHEFTIHHEDGTFVNGVGVENTKTAFGKGISVSPTHGPNLFDMPKSVAKWIRANVDFGTMRFAS